MELFLLFFLAVVPGVAFLIYILYMDRNEQEPLQLVLKIMFWGALSCLPAIIVELGLGSLLPFTNEKTLFSVFIQAFVQVAPIEEICKIAPVLIFIWNHPEFNEENDGIVYTGASALGFATLENIFYVFEKGWSVGILRSISSIPLHCFTGVIAGYFIGLAKFSNSTSEAKKRIVIGFLIAYFFHAFYDMFALSGTSLAALILPTVILIWVLGVKLMKKGRELSLIRWGNSPPTKQEFTQETPKQEGSLSVWRIWISRIIFVGVAIFWFLIIVGISTESSSGSTSIEKILLGSLVITFIPTVIGIMLEISYYKLKKAGS